MPPKGHLIVLSVIALLAGLAVMTWVAPTTDAGRVVTILIPALVVEASGILLYRLRRP